MRYKVGDRVWWTSQAGGYATTKHGVIIAVVPAYRSPHSVIGLSPGFCVRCDSSTVRRHESYLVRVGRRARLYWPRVGDLLPDREGRKQFERRGNDQDQG